MLSVFLHRRHALLRKVNKSVPGTRKTSRTVMGKLRYPHIWLQQLLRKAPGHTKLHQRTVCDIVTIVTPGGILVIGLMFVFSYSFIYFLSSTPSTSPSPHHSSLGGDWAHKATDPLPCPPQKVECPPKKLNADLNGGGAVFGVWFCLMRFTNGTGRDLRVI